MSRKIIGVTVGSPLPKPNLKQTDPRKGDYVKGTDIIPTKVSDLENDSGFLTDHQDISGKLDADKLPEAINAALAQAKASGEFDGKDGEDGYSPVVNLVQYDDGALIEAYNKTGSSSVRVKDGKDGADGLSPVATVEQTSNGAKITITDADGTTTATVTNGKDGAAGAPGKDGAAGKDGVSPTVSATRQNDGVMITVTDVNGSTNVKVRDGDDGEDGVSPSVRVEQTSDGAKIFFTDADNTSIATLYNGEKGDPGERGERGEKGDRGDPGTLEMRGAKAGQLVAVSAADNLGIPLAFEGVDQTHFAERVQILERTTFEGDGYAYYPNHLHLIDGQEYTVLWNDVEYVCTATKTGDLMALGNIGWAGAPGFAPSNEPFVIAESNETDPVCIYIIDGSTEFTISIYRDVIHKLDNKYLDLDWIPKKAGTVILPAQIARVTNGVAAVGPIDAKYRVEGTKIIVLIDGISHETEIHVDGNEIYANTEFGFSNRVMIMFSDTNTFMIGSGMDGRTVEICLPDSANSKIPVEYLPDDYNPGGSGGTSAPSDWNADEGEPGHILNRPFYSAYEPVTLLESTTLTANGSFADIDGVGFLTNLLDVRDGMECIVNYSGTTYNCTARATTFNDIPCCIIGNSYAFGDENTGEPFLVCAFSEAVASQVGIYGGVIPLDGSASFVISIAKLAEVAHKIPWKFVPDGVAGIEDGQTEIFPSTTLDLSSGKCDIPLSYFGYDFNEGETYTVKFNGLEFNCVARTLNDDGLTGKVLGNYEGDTGEPFAIIRYDDEIAKLTGISMTIRLVDPDHSSAPVTLSILRNKVVHKLDDECLPETALTRKTLVKNVQELSDTEKDDIRNEISPFNEGVTGSFTLNVDGWEEVDGKYRYLISVVFGDDSNLAIAFPADLDSRYPFYKHNCRYFYFNTFTKGVMCDTLPDKAFNVRFLLGSL